MRVRHYVGYLITFEGPDGGGKSTVLSDLVNHMREKNLDPLVVREPGGTKIGEQIRLIIKNKDNLEMSLKTETLLFQAARAQICEELIIPALNDRRIVLMDRFRDSSLAYQGVGRNIGITKINELNDWTTEGLMPDLTFLLDVDSEIGLSRIKDKGNCRLDSEGLEFHRKLRDAYLTMSEHEEGNRWVKIDAARPYEEVLTDVIKVSDERLMRAGFLERQNLGKERF